MTDKVTTPDDAQRATIKLPPTLVKEIQDDPELLVKMTRGQLAIVQDRMVQKLLNNPDASVAQYANVHEALSRNARITKQEGVGAGTGFSVVINLTGSKPELPAIDVTPTLPDAVR